MEKVIMCEVAILVEGLPLSMQTHETANAIETFVRRRLFASHRTIRNLCVGVLHGKTQESPIVYVLSDEKPGLRERVAYYTAQSLNMEYIEKNVPMIQCFLNF